MTQDKVLRGQGAAGQGLVNLELAQEQEHHLLILLQRRLQEMALRHPQIQVILAKQLRLAIRTSFFNLS
ncbi:MAG: hypothetical protein U0930_05810 [Pirellulales bacterium]